VMVDGEAEINQIARFMADTGYSRFPVYEGSRQNLVGVVHVKDVFRANNSERRDENISTLARKAIVVSTDEKLDDALNRLRGEQRHSALVQDNEGQVVGFVTMEDMLERLVGDIRDEFDKGKMKLDVEIKNLPEKEVELSPYKEWWKFWIEPRWYVPWEYIQSLPFNYSKTMRQLVFNSETYANNIVASAHKGGIENLQYSSIFLPDVIWGVGLHELMHGWCSFLGIEDKTHEYLVTSGGIEKMVKYITEYWPVTKSLYVPIFPYVG